jgi:hypothetical protein
MEFPPLGSDQARERASRGVAGSVVLAMNLIPTLALAGAVWLHVRAGMFDEGHAVWRPGGHLSIFAVFAWLTLGAIGGAALRVVGRRAPMAYVACSMALIGIILLLTG